MNKEIKDLLNKLAGLIIESDEKTLIELKRGLEIVAISKANGESYKVKLTITKSNSINLVN